jgi:hypothetical protein
MLIMTRRAGKSREEGLAASWQSDTCKRLQSVQSVQSVPYCNNMSIFSCATASRTSPPHHLTSPVSCSPRSHRLPNLALSSPHTIPINAVFKSLISAPPVSLSQHKQGPPPPPGPHSIARLQRNCWDLHPHTYSMSSSFTPQTSHTIIRPSKNTAKLALTPAPIHLTRFSKEPT